MDRYIASYTQLIFLMDSIKKSYKSFKRLLKRHPFFHFFRCFVITRKPSRQIFLDEAINNYNSKRSIPPSFIAENSKIACPEKGSFNKAIAIARFMRSSYTGGRGLGYSSAETLAIMKAHQGGVCSDFSQLMINFCVLNDVPVREWSLSEKLYGTFGHVFNEVYSDELQKWVLLDVGKSFYFIHGQTKQPLSTIEYIDLLTADQGNLVSTVNIFTSEEDETIKQAKIVQLSYFNKSHVFFLVSNYRIWLFDQVLKFRKFSPLPVLHFMLISIGGYYKYHFYINQFNLASTRSQLIRIGRKNYGAEFLD